MYIYAKEKKLEKDGFGSKKLGILGVKNKSKKLPLGSSQKK